MLDYAAWARRASTFLRRLLPLPGAITISDGIEPPADDMASWPAHSADDAPFPAEIVRFLSSASRRCAFHYRWSPSAAHRNSLAEILPGTTTVRGGGDLCQAAMYQNYAHRGWFQEQLFPMFASLGLGEGIVDLASVSGLMAAEQTHGRVPFLESNPGGLVSLAAEAFDGSRAVVFVERAGSGDARILSESFDRFLVDWESTCYAGLTLGELSPWLAADSGRLAPDPIKAQALRRLLCGTNADPKENSP